jgi:Na+/proline symporter
MMYGLHPIDLAVIAAYFAVVTAVGFWAARRVRGEQDYFMGGRRFGKGLLVMHWLCTGTHSEQAVQVCGAAARVGLGGIWYQWMWLFSTPFYWFIAPITRRLRVTTTGDFFRIRYGRSLEMLYTVVALGYFVLSVGMLLRGAGLAIAGATGGQVPGDWAVIGLSLLFATYIVAGGLIAAAYTDFLQGMFIIVLSVMLVPAGLSVVGGLHGLHAALPPNMFGMTAPRGAPAGDPWFVAAMSALGLAGIIAQPHVMTATGSGKTELEARVGMVYGNFIKRLLTIAWAFTGLVAAAAFAGELGAHQAGSLEHVHASEELFGRSVRRFLGTGWRGLMVASLVAGVTSAETLMVVGSAVFTRNLYAHLVPRRSDRHYLWTGRAAGAGMLGAGILFGLYGGSVTWLYTSSVQMIGLVGPAFWAGVVWRRANAAAAWASVAAGVLFWTACSADPQVVRGVPFAYQASAALVWLAEQAGLRQLGAPLQILCLLALEFGVLLVVGLCTRPQSPSMLDPFFARLLTPVGKEAEVRALGPSSGQEEQAALGLPEGALDFARAACYGYATPRRWGLELPRLGWVDWAGFAAAWLLVLALIGLLAWLAQLGA